MFQVGQKVVCVWGDGSTSVWGELLPTKGSIYTVRAVCCYESFNPGIYLNEIHNPAIATCVGVLERGFFPRRFRPLTERKTDISVFRQLLTPAPRERVGDLCGND